MIGSILIMILINEIVEYDMEHAGPSILYEGGHITKETYIGLISLPKKERVIKTGLLIKDNSEFYNYIQKGYTKYINIFIKKNNLKPDNVVEISHDAIWLVGVTPSITKFGEINFRKKRRYDVQYIYEKKNIRIYYNMMTTELDIRGGSFNEESDLYPILKRIMQGIEHNKDYYDLLHEVKRNLKKDKDHYKFNVINGLDNRKLINNMIVEMLK